MIVTTVIIIVFVNVIRWAELADVTTVRTWKDYLMYNNRIFFKYNLVLLLITTVMYLLTKIFNLP